MLLTSDTVVNPLTDGLFVELDLCIIV